MAGDATAADTPSPATVFLSYARVDRRRAERVAVALQAAGMTVWWDAMIEGGAAFATSIRTALEAADAVVVLWSAASIDSDWVRDEAAQGRDRKRLVPVTLDGSTPPLGYRQYQAIDLAKWRGRADAPQVAALVRAIGTVRGQAPIARVASQKGVSRRTVIALGSGAAVAAVGGGAMLAWRRGMFGEGVVANSIAILPFKNLSGDPSQAFFSDGLTEEFRAALARNDALKVMAGTSSKAADAANDDPATIAKKLDVAFLLDGSVQRAGDMLRISANLTDGRTGFNRWSQTFDRKLADVFTLQTEIANTVAQALSVQIATTAPAPGGTSVVAAYEAYLRGRALFNSAKDEPTDRAALAQYDLALAADPDFALAHAARSRSLAAIATEYAPADQLRPMYDAASAAAQRAVDIAPELAEAQLALGFARFNGHLDVAGARGAYDRAYALGHGDADILLLFALYCVRVGRSAEARAAITRALALDPLNPRTFRAAGSINYATRRYVTAISFLRPALALNPKMSNAHALLGNCLYQLGKVPGARAEYLAEPHEIFALSGLAITNHRLGDEPAARQAMTNLIAGSGDSALYQQAEVLAQWGDTTASLRALARAYAVGDSGLLYLSTDPMLDPLTGQSGFTNLVKRLHLA